MTDFASNFVRRRAKVSVLGQVVGEHCAVAFTKFVAQPAIVTPAEPFERRVDLRQAWRGGKRAVHERVPTRNCPTESYKKSSL